MPSVVVALWAFCCTDALICCSEALVSSTLAACWLAPPDSVAAVCDTCAAAPSRRWLVSPTWRTVPAKASISPFRRTATCCQVPCSCPAGMRAPRSPWLAALTTRSSAASAWRCSVMSCHWPTVPTRVPLAVKIGVVITS
jgi:hypothetical protein